MRQRCAAFAGLTLALCLAGLPAQAQQPAQQPAPPRPGTAPTLLDDDPPALRALLQQAAQQETAVTERDPVEGPWQAARLYCEAARHGSTEAQFRLGMLYAFGQGVPERRALTAALFSQAALLGHAQAAQMLESIQLSAHDLPECLLNAQAMPERAPMPPPPLPPESTIPPEFRAENIMNIDDYVRTLPASRQWIVPLARTLSAWYELDPRLVLSVIAAESNFQTGVRSPKDAQGLMQLIPATAERFNVRNAYDAAQNLRGGMRYLRWLLSYYRGNIVYALAAYNAGEGRVDRYKGVPPFDETRAYVRRIMGMYGRGVHAFDETLTPGAPWLMTSTP